MRIGPQWERLRRVAYFRPLTSWSLNLCTGLTLQTCDVDPRSASTLKSPPIGQRADDTFLTITFGYPVGGPQISFDVYSTSAFGILDTLLGSFATPNVDQLTAASASYSPTLVTLVEWNNTICLPRDAAFGFTLVPQNAVSPLGTTLAGIKDVVLTAQPCVYSPSIDGMRFACYDSTQPYTHIHTHTHTHAQTKHMHRLRHE